MKRREYDRIDHSKRRHRQATALALSLQPLLSQDINLPHDPTQQLKMKRVHKQRVIASGKSG
jgi:hypothetical protein